MRLVTFSVDGSLRFGSLVGESVVDLADTTSAAVFRAELERAGADTVPRGMRELLVGGAPAMAAARAMSERAGESGVRTWQLSDVVLKAPLQHPRAIIGVGRNYRDHAAEATIELPELPRLFPKWPSTVVGPGDPIVIPPLTSQLDWEVELAVVIGTPARDVALDQALEYVAGYTIVNDVSARDIQMSRPEQLALGKNFRSFTPMGSWIVTRDEVPDPADVRLRSWVNDQLMQDGHTKDLIFSVAHLVSFLSSVLDLSPGDVIATGTPAGVGAFRTPPIWLKAGDVVRMELTGLCVLSNPVLDA